MFAEWSVDARRGCPEKFVTVTNSSLELIKVNLDKEVVWVKCANCGAKHRWTRSARQLRMDYGKLAGDDVSPRQVLHVISNRQLRKDERFPIPTLPRGNDT